MQDSIEGLTQNVAVFRGSRIADRPRMFSVDKQVASANNSPTERMHWATSAGCATSPGCSTRSEGKSPNSTHGTNIPPRVSVHWSGIFMRLRFRRSGSWISNIYLRGGPISINCYKLQVTGWRQKALVDPEMSSKSEMLIPPERVEQKAGSSVKLHNRPSTLGFFLSSDVSDLRHATSTTPCHLGT